MRCCAGCNFKLYYNKIREPILIMFASFWREFCALYCDINISEWQKVSVGLISEGTIGSQIWPCSAVDQGFETVHIQGLQELTMLSSRCTDFTAGSAVCNCSNRRDSRDVLGAIAVFVKIMMRTWVGFTLCGFLLSLVTLLFTVDWNWMVDAFSLMCGLWDVVCMRWPRSNMPSMQRTWTLWSTRSWRAR